MLVVLIEEALWNPKQSSHFNGFRPVEASNRQNPKTQKEGRQKDHTNKRMKSMLCLLCQLSESQGTLSLYSGGKKKPLHAPDKYEGKERTDCFSGLDHWSHSPHIGGTPCQHSRRQTASGIEQLMQQH